MTERTDSADYVAYEENMEAYVGAITTYRLSYNVYLDALEDPDPDVRKKADRDWQAKAPLLENSIKSAFRKLQSGNAKYVGVPFYLHGGYIIYHSGKCFR